MVRPPLDDSSHRVDEAVARAGGSESGIQEAEIVVMEIELGATVLI